MPDLGVPELLIIALVILVLFGSKKLPGAARSLGQSLRIFKAETKGLHDDSPVAVKQTLPPATSDVTIVNGQPLRVDGEITDRR